MSWRGGGARPHWRIALQGALQRRGRARPSPARSPAAGGGARGGGGSGGARAGGSARRPLREATLRFRLQVRTRRSSARTRAGGGAWDSGTRSPQPPRVPAHTCQARRGPRSSGRGRPRLPNPSRPEAPRARLRLGSRVGGRGGGRRLGTGVAGASQEGWWPEWRVPVSPGPWVAGLGLGVWREVSVGAVGGGGPGGNGVGVFGAFWKEADRGYSLVRRQRGCLGADRRRGARVGGTGWRPRVWEGRSVCGGLAGSRPPGSADLGGGGGERCIRAGGGFRVSQRVAESGFAQGASLHLSPTPRRHAAAQETDGRHQQRL